MQEITINDTVIEIIRKKIKNIYLTVCPPIGTVRITAPLRSKEETIRLFVQSKLAWIQKQKAKFTFHGHYPVALQYISGETHFYQGQQYVLKRIHTDKRNKVILSKDFILEFHVSERATVTQCEKIMANWYRKQMKEVILPLAQKWENTVGVSDVEWKIRAMKARWGSCNIREKRILLNLELIKKPVHCLEYVIVHEIVHLFERKHNARFKAYMDKLLPSWRSYKKQLNENSVEEFSTLVPSREPLSLPVI